jgi:hypothetical protein
MKNLVCQDARKFFGIVSKVAVEHDFPFTDMSARVHRLSAGLIGIDAFSIGGKGGQEPDADRLAI